MTFHVNSESQSLKLLKKHKYKIAIGAIVASILITGYLFSGGTTPNSSIGSVFNPPAVYKTNLGAINGYVYGSFGLPAVGATVVAAAQQGGAESTHTAFISIDGKYVFTNLEPGNYILVVSYPDGTNQVLNNVNINQGSIQTIKFNY